MIKREMYMQRIRPFINTDLVKVMTGIRRCGKSVMLELIKEELKNIGISDLQFLSFNFEDMRNSHLCTAQALHDEVIQRTRNLSGIFFLTKFRKLSIGKNVSILSAWSWIVISILPVLMPGFFPENLRLYWVAVMWNSPYIPFLFLNFANCIFLFFRILLTLSFFKNTFF